MLLAAVLVVGFFGMVALMSNEDNEATLKHFCELECKGGKRKQYSTDYNTGVLY